MKKFLFVLVVFFSVCSLSAQNSKVLDPDISGTYEGKCKKGLANGKGIAIGVDKYEGYFKKGKKEKSGTYTFKNGDVYKGEFSNDFMHGKGVLNKASGERIEGFWKFDKYVGEAKEDFDGYTILSSSNLPQKPLFKQLNNKGDKLIIEVDQKLEQVSGMELIEYTSGVVTYLAKDKLEINGAVFPFTGQLTYSVPNKADNFLVKVIVKFEVKDKGLWRINFRN